MKMAVGLSCGFAALLSILSVAAIGRSAPAGSAPGTLIEVGNHKIHIHCVGPPDSKPSSYSNPAVAHIPATGTQCSNFSPHI